MTLRLTLVCCATVLALAASGCAGSRASGAATPGPQTRAASSGYTETSTYADVLAFLDALPPDPRRHRTTFGQTVEGRALPLVVWGAPDATAESVRARGKTRVLVFANIHAGEVEGKEALLILLRDLAAGRHAEWADSLVLLIAPIYNADGNERIALDNRPLQLGPVGGTGQRPNAQGLDLNRDFTKLASPEARSLVGLMRDADPHLVVDLHTSDGSPMAYGLTYAPGLHPSTPTAISDDLFGRWLPDVSARLEQTDNLLTYHYGNIPGAFGEEAAAPRGWYSFSAQPRFSTNYVGIRGRYAILSEAYSYDPFETRIHSTLRFVEEVVDRAWREASHMRSVTDAADRTSIVGQDVAVRSFWAPLGAPARIVLGRVDTVAHPVTGEPMRRNTGDRLPETIPAYVRFEASETTRAPRAYAVMYGSHQQPIQDLLDAHGITYEWGGVWGTDREGFRIDSVTVAERPFQGVRGQETFGRWERVPAETGPPPRLAPTLIVPVDQPLGRLVVALLDPRSDDGVFAWALVPVADLLPGELAPVQRLP